MRLTVSMNEAAALLGVSVIDIRRKIRSGVLAVIRTEGMRRKLVTVQSLSALTETPVETIVELLRQGSGEPHSNDRSSLKSTDDRGDRPHPEDRRRHRSPGALQSPADRGTRSHPEDSPPSGPPATSLSDCSASKSGRIPDRMMSTYRRVVAAEGN